MGVDTPFTGASAVEGDAIVRAVGFVRFVEGDGCRLAAGLHELYRKVKMAMLKRGEVSWRNESPLGTESTYATQERVTVSCKIWLAMLMLRR